MALPSSDKRDGTVRSDSAASSPLDALAQVAAAMPESQLLTSIVEGSDDAIFAKDGQGRILFWNRGAQRLYGYSPADVVGKSVAILIPPERKGEERVIIERLFRGEKIDHFETVRVHQDGHRIPISLSISPILDDAGQIVAAAVIARDISARVESEALRRANELKEHFVAVVSHELRTPLTSISGFTHTLIDRWETLDDAQKLQFLQIVGEQSERLHRLVSDLLVLSRVGSTHDLARQRVTLARCARTSLAEMHHQDDVPVSTRGDGIVCATPDHLKQIVTNLVANAYTHGAAPVRIDIDSESDPAWVTMRVTDSGPGVPEDFLPSLFQKFARPQSASTEGTGLGLSIVRALAEAHGGSAWYERHDGETTFAVRLPSTTPEP